MGGVPTEVFDPSGMLLQEFISSKDPKECDCLCIQTTPLLHTEVFCSRWRRTLFLCLPHPSHICPASALCLVFFLEPLFAYLPNSELWIRSAGLSVQLIKFSRREDMVEEDPLV
ncbi:hypothetical protein GOODEAATRI_030367 [Goodea atripinnis]|uniref:Uncharacterized protein n=1 Tax=Goodea atripinnis TaxID=208336 RepID=A0ABV0NZF3_9TELE